MGAPRVPKGCGRAQSKAGGISMGVSNLVSAVLGWRSCCPQSWVHGAPRPLLLSPLTAFLTDGQLASLLISSPGWKLLTEWKAEGDGERGGGWGAAMEGVSPHCAVMGKEGTALSGAALCHRAPRGPGDGVMG